MRKKSTRNTLSQKPSRLSWLEGSCFPSRGVGFRLGKMLLQWRWSIRKPGGSSRRCLSTRCVRKKWIVTVVGVSARPRVVYSGSPLPPLSWVCHKCPDLLQLLYRVQANIYCLQWRQDYSSKLFSSLHGRANIRCSKWMVVIAIRTYLLTDRTCKQAIAIKTYLKTFHHSSCRHRSITILASCL